MESRHRMAQELIVLATSLGYDVCRVHGDQVKVRHRTTRQVVTLPPQLREGSRINNLRTLIRRGARTAR